MPRKKLAQPVQIEFMDGAQGKPITHATWQRISIQGENGIKEQTIKFLIADIPEGMILGMNWLEWADPDISWKKKTLSWRNPLETVWSKTQDTPQKVLVAKKARQRIIQSEIQSNEAPAWVSKEFADVFMPKEKIRASNVPHRPGLDYEIELKPLQAQSRKRASILPRRARNVSKTRRTGISARAMETQQVGKCRANVVCCKTRGREAPMSRLQKTKWLHRR